MEKKFHNKEGLILAAKEAIDLAIRLRGKTAVTFTCDEESSEALLGCHLLITVAPEDTTFVVVERVRQAFNAWEGPFETIAREIFGA